VISRYFVIALAFGAAVYRASQGAWVEATGLIGLGAGLVVLKLATTRPALRPLAYLAFLVTAAAITAVLLRQYA
jgi:Na+/phosphate symporter